jgi:hypothetical protein
MLPTVFNFLDQSCFSFRTRRANFHLKLDIFSISVGDFDKRVHGGNKFKYPPLLCKDS